MFGKSKKKGSSSAKPVQEMFQSIAEDPADDPNSVVNMEGSYCALPTQDATIDCWFIAFSPLTSSSLFINEGIAELGDKLGIDVTEDLRILVLLWKMDCKEKPGSITVSEWTQGCETLGVDSWEGLKEQLPGLDTGFLETSQFKEFYKYCFKFNLSGTHRTLQKEVVLELLRLVLKDRVPTKRTESFCNFLESTDNYARITMDQWNSFLDFSNEVGDDVTNYDESTSAWPVMIDEFVEYMDKQQIS